MSHSDGSCFTVPISLSNINSCENNNCYFSQIANLVIPVGQGNEACVKFVPPDGLSTAQDLTITIDHAYFSYTASSFYYTDDPAVNMQGICGCPGGSSTSCSSDRLKPKYNDVVLCRTGYHKDSDCFLTNTFGTPGTYAFQLSMSMKQRFKILQFNSNVNKHFGIVAKTNSMVWAMEYNGNVMTSTDNPSFNITVISDTSFPSFTPEFLVFDMQSTTDYWLLTNADVNNINSFDSGKIGWVKVNQTQKVDPNLLNNIGLSVKSCDPNTFSYSTSWLSTQDYLVRHIDFLSAAKAPGSMLYDDDYKMQNPGLKEVPNLEILPYTYLQKGFVMVDYSGNIDFIGFANDDTVSPEPDVDGSTILNAMPSAWQTFGGDIITTCVSDTVGCQYNLTQIEYHLSRSTVNYETFSFMSWHTKDKKHEGINMAIVPPIIAPVWITVCNWDAKVTSWPSYRDVVVSCRGNFTFTETDIPRNLTNSVLENRISNGALTIAIQFTNLSISFQQTVIQPAIDNIAFDNGNFLIRAKSLTVPGNCYIASNPAGFLTTQQLTLAVTDLDFKFPITTGYANSRVCIDIQCYNNHDQKCVDVIFGSPDSQDLIIGNETEPYILPPDYNLPKLPSKDSAWDWFTNIWNFDHWWDYLSAIGIVIVFGIIAFLVLFIFLPLLFKLFQILSKCRRGVSNGLDNFKKLDIESELVPILNNRRNRLY